MIKKSSKPAHEPSLQARMLRTTSLHFYILIAYGAAIIAFDSWNLITHESVAQRWTYGGALAIVCCVVWFLLKRYTLSTRSITFITYALITADILFAAFNVYAQRGMASKAVMLFALPLLVAYQLKDRATLLVTAGLSVTAYSIAAVRYFHLFYGEGYRIELYGEVGFYSALIVVFALLLMPFAKRP